MRMAICRLPDGGSITVQAAERGRVLRAGDRVDLDAVLVPAAATAAAHTWADALGHHVEDHFELEAEAVAAEPAYAATAADEE
jgi:TolB-like protein